MHRSSSHVVWRLDAERGRDISPFHGQPVFRGGLNGDRNRGVCGFGRGARWPREGWSFFPTVSSRRRERSRGSQRALPASDLAEARRDCPMEIVDKLRVEARPRRRSTRRSRFTTVIREPVLARRCRGCTAQSRGTFSKGPTIFFDHHVHRLPTRPGCRPAARIRRGS